MKIIDLINLGTSNDNAQSGGVNDLAPRKEGRQTNGSKPTMKRSTAKIKAIAAAAVLVVSPILASLSLVGCMGNTGSNGATNNALHVGVSKSSPDVKVMVVDAGKSTSGKTKITIPDGAKSLVLAGQGANAKFSDATVTLTSPDGNSHTKITLQNGSVTGIEGGNALQSESDLQTKTNVVMPGNPSEETEDAGCSAENGGCLVDFASVMVGKPVAGEWDLSVETGANPTTMTLAVVGNKGVNSVSQVQNLTNEAGNEAGVSITTRGGCSWLVRATINTVCKIVLRIGANAIIALMYEYGLGWIINVIGVSVVKYLIGKGISYGCNWFTDQICSRV